MRKIWWTWDIRMRWYQDFSFTSESYEKNYYRAIDAAKRYEVEAIVIWGFLRDMHGGIESAKRICDYAYKNDISIFPGVGIDHYGGVYYDGKSPFSLDCYLREHPEVQAIDKEGKPKTVKWPLNDPGARSIACSSCDDVMGFYKKSLEWLIKTFDLRGFQIEQGDNGLCHCEKCQANRGVIVHKCGSNDFSSSVHRMVPVINHALEINKNLTIITETYCGLLCEQLEPIRDLIKHYPDDIYLSWAVYRPGVENDRLISRFNIDEISKSPTKHGCLALTTNSDAALGERDDRKNIKKVLHLGKKAGLDMTYIYGEYPDTWPITKQNYEAWSSCASDLGTFI